METLLNIRLPWHKKYPISHFIFIFLALVKLQGASLLQAHPGEEIITAAAYCEFLNAVAPSDLDGSYNTLGQKIEDESWKMGISYVVRSGEIGNYYYEVVQGSENLPMGGISFLDASRFCDWKNAGTATFNVNSYEGGSSCVDEQLKSNSLYFYLIPTSAKLEKNSNNNPIREWSDFIGLAVFFFEGEGVPLNEEHPIQENQQIALEDDAIPGADLTHDQRELILKKSIQNVGDPSLKKEEYQKLQTLLKGKELTSLLAHHLDKWTLATSKEKKSKAIEAIKNLPNRNAEIEFTETEVRFHKNIQKAIQLLDDAERYKNRFGKAVEEVTDPRMLHFYFQRMESVQKNIQKLEKTACSVIQLAETILDFTTRLKIGNTQHQNGYVNEAIQLAHNAITLHEQYGEIITDGNPRSARLIPDQALIFQLQAFYRKYKIYCDEARAERKNEEANNWFNISLAFLRVTRALERAIAFEDQDNQIQADRWKEVAREYQEAASFYMQAAEAHAEGKMEEMEGCVDAGNAFSSVAEELRKPIELGAPGNQIQADRWREVAKEYKGAVPFYTRAAEAHAEEKMEEANIWFNAGRALSHAAEELRKAMELEAQGNQIQADHWREVARGYQDAAPFLTQAAKAHAEGKTEEKNVWLNSGKALLRAALDRANNISAH